MKTKLFVIVVFIISVSSSFAQKNNNEWGVGLRLGDLTGVTLKKHMTQSALELSIGRSHLLRNSKYYDDKFNNWYNDNRFGYDDFRYVSYNSSTPIGVQLHYLFQKDINRIGDANVTGLQWYYGFGVQFAYQNYTYDYQYKLQGNSEWFYAEGEKVSDLDFGADGVIGIEYTFKNAPVTVFADAILFMEIFDNPFSFKLQGGLGGRFRF